MRLIFVYRFTQPTEPTMYKIYDAANNTICVTFLHKVRDLTGATDAQIKKLAVSKVMRINGFDVINYTH